MEIVFLLVLLFEFSEDFERVLWTLQEYQIGGIRQNQLGSLLLFFRAKVFYLNAIPLVRALSKGHSFRGSFLTQALRLETFRV